MENKTIGAFIAVMRKSKGLTQKELAEKLGVSDKTVSHWERDETYPDISIIPILADIFDVTCDELIRGEKTSVVREEISCEKTEKQLKNLIKRRYEKFRTQALISVMIFLAGFVFSLVMYDRFAWNIFLTTLMFFVVYAFCFAIFKMQYLSAVQSNEIDIKTIEEYKIKTNTLTFYLVTIGIFVLLSSLCLYLLIGYFLILNFIVAISAYFLLFKLGYINKINISEKVLVILKPISITALSVSVLVLVYYFASVFIPTHIQEINQPEPIYFEKIEEFEEFMEIKKDKPYFAEFDSGFVEGFSNTVCVIENNVYKYFDAENNVITEFEWNNQKVKYFDFLHEEDSSYTIHVYEYVKDYEGPVSDIFYMIGLVYYPLAVLIPFIICGLKIKRKVKA